MVKTKPAADTDREASNSRQSNTTGHNSGASDKGSPPHYATWLYSLRKHATNVYPMWPHTSGTFQCEGPMPITMLPSRMSTVTL